MRKVTQISFLLTFVVTIQIQAQFTYFNQLNGPGPGNPETTGNLEVVGDEIVIWGGMNGDAVQSKFVRKYDNDGNFVAEQLFHSIDAFIYSGSTASFLSINNENNFLFTQGIADSQGLHGLIYKIGPDLYTLWTRVYDEYFPETYFLPMHLLIVDLY